MATKMRRYKPQFCAKCGNSLGDWRKHKDEKGMYLYEYDARKGIWDSGYRMPVPTPPPPPKNVMVKRG